MILLSKGNVIDGSGRPGEQASVLIKKNRITDIGQIDASPDMEFVDCSGLTISPGFIDVHSHGDLEVLEHRSDKIKQGVTTEVVGNCGFSLFPKLAPSTLVPSFDLFERRGAKDWNDAQAYFNDLQDLGSLTNVAALTGHSTLRANVSGIKAKPLNSQEWLQIEHQLSACLEQGSIGLSTGLNEVPSSYGDFEELTKLCRVVKKYGAFYTSHLRDYKFHIIEAVEEALNLGRKTQVPVQLSHLQTVGRKNWDKMDAVLNLVDKARREGVDVGMDAYPYLAGSAHLTQSLPSWVLEGGTSWLLERLSDKDTRARIADETEANMSNGWDNILITSVGKKDQQPLIGNTILQIAEQRGRTGVETALDLLLETEATIVIVSFNQSEENLRKVLTHPLTSIITDGLFTEGNPHPRTFGTYPTLFGQFVREKQWFTVEEAVHKVTALPAERFKLNQRGLLALGNWADVTVFDADRIGTKANYMDPHHAPEGILHVLVNGKWVLQAGKLLNQYPGCPLRY